MSFRKITDAIIVILLLIIILIYVNPLLASWLGVAGSAVAELLMVVVALAAVLIRREDIRENFSLRVPTVRSFFGALLLVLGSNALQNAASFFYVAVTDSIWAGDTLYLEKAFGNVDPYVTLIVVALIPAVCEELIFRGFLLNCFKTKKGYGWSVVITALIFAVIHFDLYKFFPILIMGLSYGYIASVTGSFLLGAIFHFINNSLGVISFYVNRTAAETALTLDVSAKVFAFYAIAVMGVGAIFVYYGIMSLSGRQRKRKVTKLVWLLSVAMLIGGSLGVTLSMMDELVSTPYELQYADKIREDVSFTESFEIAEYCMASVNASVFCSEAVDCDIIITGSDGKEIYSYDDGASVMTELAPGSYTVSYSFDTEEGNTVAYDVIVRADVTCVSLGTDAEAVTAESQ